jgi:putative endonuclease
MATPADARRQAAERRGRRAEAVALLYLRLKGYRLLSRRYRTPVGEIDLIMRRGRTIAFIEVKQRGEAGAAAEAITATGQRRIAQAASAWLARHPAAEYELRFDAVLISSRSWPIHLPGAFTAGS